MLVTCRECGAQVSATAPACVKCGAPRAVFAAPRPPLHTSHAGPWVLGAIAVFGVLLYLIPSPTPEQRAATEAQISAERTIDTCWEVQARKSFSPETQRFVAGACELAEEDYRTKYGRYYKKDGRRP